MRVSVIIPHMNQPEFLERCLASLALQIDAVGMSGAAEAIVVDNGSRELPVATVAKYSWAQLAQESGKGPGLARNKGISIARSDLLAFIDADIVAHPQWLATVVQEFEDHPETQIIGGDVGINLADPLRPTILEAYESVFAYRQEEYIAKYRFSGTGNLAMRRFAYEKVGPFAGIGVAEDRDWGQRAFAAGLNIKYVPQAIVYHPARKTFTELTKKWDRHIAHDFNEKAHGVGGRLKWAGLIVAVAASGIVDIRRIVASGRINSWRDCGLASVMLLRIRMYRAWKMLGMIFQHGPRGPTWNG
jgi:glycosyltransferase involved in cell wall biosynthesis